ncbi:hypothetical protein FACS189476_12020 [Spirochaetia bacterium]|nr:hypothetical protein FACS189476_12020 [Spirochaetia bacterium]
MSYLMKKLILASMILVLILGISSCRLNDDEDDPPPSRKFWAQNASTEEFYQVDAEQLAVGKKCVIWAEKSAKVSAETAKSIASEYDSNIYGKMLNVFGITANFTYNGKVVATNTLEYADWLGDGDGKLAILLLDIKDEYQSSSDGYVAGYFWAGNFYKDPPLPGYRSNEMDMMYVDVNPGVPDSLQSNVTFAHELQHLMNFATSTVIPERIVNDQLISMDTWIDEGLSTAAEYVYLGRHDTSRIAWFNQDREETIAQGNNFFVWGNHKDVPNAILDDYATAYLFFQWLRIQSVKGIDIYKDIITSPHADYRAVTTAMSQTWETLLGNWLKANYMNASSGADGYKGELAARVWAVAGGSKPLYPGEGVYSISNSTSSDTGNVRFAQISRSTTVTGLPYKNATDELTAAYTTGYIGDRVLMYNANVDQSPVETGTLPGTGETKPSLTSLSVRGVLGEAGPFAISAQDVLHRKGHNGREIDFGDLPRVEIDGSN